MICCPNCKADCLAITVEDGEFLATWSCPHCGFSAREDESLEIDCEVCNSRASVWLYQNEAAFRYCYVCGGLPKATFSFAELNTAAEQFYAGIVPLSVRLAELFAERSSVEIADLFRLADDVSEFCYQTGKLERDKKLSIPDAYDRLLAKFPFLSPSVLNSSLSRGSYAAWK